MEKLWRFQNSLTTLIFLIIIQLCYSSPYETNLNLEIPEFALKGENVTITCEYDSPKVEILPLHLTVIFWKFSSHIMKIKFYREDLYSTPHVLGTINNVHFVENDFGKIKVQLTNVSETDAGEYSCTLFLFGDKNYNSNKKSLIVSDFDNNLDTDWEVRNYQPFQIINTETRDFPTTITDYKDDTFQYKEPQFTSTNSISNMNKLWSLLEMQRKFAEESKQNKQPIIQLFFPGQITIENMYINSERPREDSRQQHVLEYLQPDWNIYRPYQYQDLISENSYEPEYKIGGPFENEYQILSTPWQPNEPSELNSNDFEKKQEIENLIETKSLFHSNNHFNEWDLIEFKEHLPSEHSRQKDDSLEDFTDSNNSNEVRSTEKPSSEEFAESIKSNDWDSHDTEFDVEEFEDIMRLFFGDSVEENNVSKGYLSETKSTENSSESKDSTDLNNLNEGSIESNNSNEKSKEFNESNSSSRESSNKKSGDSGKWNSNEFSKDNEKPSNLNNPKEESFSKDSVEAKNSEEFEVEVNTYESPIDLDLAHSEYEGSGDSSESNDHGYWKGFPLSNFDYYDSWENPHRTFLREKLLLKTINEWSSEEFGRPNRFDTDLRKRRMADVQEDVFGNEITRPVDYDADYFNHNTYSDIEDYYDYSEEQTNKPDAYFELTTENTELQRESSEKSASEEVVADSFENSYFIDNENSDTSMSSTTGVLEWWKRLHQLVVSEILNRNDSFEDSEKTESETSDVSNDYYWHRDYEEEFSTEMTTVSSSTLNPSQPNFKEYTTQNILEISTELEYEEKFEKAFSSAISFRWFGVNLFFLYCIICLLHFLMNF